MYDVLNTTLNPGVPCCSLYGNIGYMQILYLFLYKKLEHLWILVTSMDPRTHPY